MNVRVVGLDVSLTSTGMSDGIASRVVQTSPEDGSVERRMARIASAAESFVKGIGVPGAAVADLVVIESGAFSRGAQAAGAEQLAALRFMIRVGLTLDDLRFAMVTPTGLKAYVSGHGVATKGRMVEAVREAYGVDFGQVMVKDGRYDLADAFGLAAMGYDHLGQPLPRSGPPAPRKSLLAVKWPEG